MKTAGHVLFALICVFGAACANAQALRLHIGDSTVTAPSDGVMLIVDGETILHVDKLPIAPDSIGGVTVIKPRASEDIFGHGARLGVVILNTKRRSSPSSAAGCSDDQTYFEFQLDQPAVYKALNAPIKQPLDREPSSKDRDPLAVIAQFVVDTTGSVDQRTFKILRAPSDKAAHDAVIASAAWHYSSAMRGGCRVKQIVQATMR